MLSKVFLVYKLCIKVGKCLKEKDFVGFFLLIRLEVFYKTRNEKILIK